MKLFNVYDGNHQAVIYAESEEKARARFIAHVEEDLMEKVGDDVSVFEILLHKAQIISFRSERKDVFVVQTKSYIGFVFASTEKEASTEFHDSCTPLEESIIQVEEVKVPYDGKSPKALCLFKKRSA
jgi:hypothetical protein